MSKNLSANLVIMPAKTQDFADIWRIFQDVIESGDTYVNSNTTQEEAFAKWFNQDTKTFVAYHAEKIVGAYLIKPNQIDRGSHIANCSYIVDKNARGLGIGKALGLHSLKIAKDLNYRAVQFNFVVSTNIAAVKLWQSIGFEIIESSQSDISS